MKLPSALQEADHWGWLLYADKQALKEGRADEVYARVRLRARRSMRMQWLFVPGLLVWMLNAVLALGNQEHGKLGPIVGWVGIAMVAALALFLLPWSRRTIRRLEARLDREALHETRG